ncbi:MAG TPA: hydroxymethylbilane synthase, partial [Chloroflexota bacterium]
VAEVLDPAVCLPAPGQGALAVQVRQDDPEARRLVASLDHEPTRRAVLAERAFLRLLGAGCRLPVAALARVEGEEVVLEGLVAAPDGSVALRDVATGPGPEDVAEALLQRLRKRGLEPLLVAMEAAR